MTIYSHLFFKKKVCMCVCFPQQQCFFFFAFAIIEYESLGDQEIFSPRGKKFPGLL